MIQYYISGEFKLFIVKVPFNCKMNSMDPISTDSFHELGLNKWKNIDRTHFLKADIIYTYWLLFRLLGFTH